MASARACVVASAVALAGAQTLHAQPAPAPSDQTAHAISYLDAAKLLMASGKLAEAKTVLDALHKAAPKDREVLFLQGLLAEAMGDLDGAVARFRAILADEPANPRVRLELARAFFLKRDDTNAQRQFSLALAGDLPAAVRANVDHYVEAIRARRSWSLNVSVALAPDSNINAATSARQVDLYGLPFDLSDEARRQGGAGVAFDAAGEWAPRVTQRMRLRLGAAVDSLIYRHRDFDDTSVYAYAGPKLIAGRWEISPLATETRRWAGNEPYYSGAGGRLEVSYTPGARLRLEAAVDRQMLTYRLNPGQSGAVTGVAGDVVWAASPNSLIHATVGVTRQAARDPAYANTLTSVGLGYLRELPKGFTAAVEPSFGRATYDAPLAAFGVARHDRLARVSVSLLNRRLAYRGFSPRVTYSFTDNASTIALYSYRRSRVELRLSRTF